MYCTNCGSNLDDKAVVCPHCGCPTDNYYKYMRQPAQNTAPAHNIAPAQKHATVNGYAIAALALGVAGLITGYLFCIVPALGLIFSIIGLYKSVKLNSGRGLAIGGLVTSIIGVVFWCLYFIVVIFQDAAVYY